MVARQPDAASAPKKWMKALPGSSKGGDGGGKKWKIVLFFFFDEYGGSFCRWQMTREFGLDTVIILNNGYVFGAFAFSVTFHRNFTAPFDFA